MTDRSLPVTQADLEECATEGRSKTNLIIENFKKRRKRKKKNSYILFDDFLDIAQICPEAINHMAGFTQGGE